MYEELKIILYPDPRLKKMSRPVVQFDEGLKALAMQMIGLMREEHGVGLAAAQVGENVRLFVMNESGEEHDVKIYVNPELFDAEGSEEGEEGCLSLPGINVQIVRDKSIKIKAQDLEGNRIEETASGYRARIWQHEFDHLNGTLLIDRMGSVARLANRKTLKDLEEKYAAAHPTKARKKHHV